MSYFKILYPAMFAALTSPAFAVSVTNSVFHRSACELGDGITQTTSDPVDLTSIRSDDNCSVTLRSFAAGGVVGLSGKAEQLGTFGRPAIETVFDADTNIRGISITVEEGVDADALLATIGKTIPITLNGHLEAVVSGDMPGGPGSSSSRAAVSQLRAFVEISGTKGISDTVRASNDRNLRSSDSNITSDTGPDSFDGGVSATIDANWQDPINVIFRLQADMDLFGSVDTETVASVNALNSLGFASTGPAFILPDGLTVNAPEIGIIDNQWTDPRNVTPDPTPIPLPPTLLFLLAASGWLGLMRKRSRPAVA